MGGDQQVLSSFGESIQQNPEHRWPKCGFLAHAVKRLTHGTHLIPLSLVTTNVRYESVCVGLGE
jgi:hypothetical protein